MMTLCHVEVTNFFFIDEATYSLQESDTLITLNRSYKNELCNPLTRILSFQEWSLAVSEVMTQSITQYYSTKCIQSRWRDSVS